MTRFIVLTGSPASGKSTSGAALSQALALPLLDKDDFLESLFEEQGAGDAAWRSRLSRAADVALERCARQSSGAVIISWWRHPRSASASGTDTAWLAWLNPAPVEVHCRCAPELAVERFFARRRHAGHLDALRRRDDERRRFERAARLGPLGLARCIEVEAAQAVDLDALIGRVTAA